MPDGQSLEFSGVTKRFGAVTAVSGFTARVDPGQVTGFLGPNGAGKTTSLRILLGLVRATDGTATIGGVPYAKLDRPLQTVGAVLEASSFHPGRTAANHLLVYAQAAGIARARVDDVLGLVGLADAAGRKVGGFSLGMRQRLGLAYALLGDPGVLVLDEPANGLDPEGIRWMRGFLRELAREGRTVLVSSHLLTEVQQTVDALLIISAGRLVFQGSLDELADPSEYATVVDAPDRAALSAALSAAGVSFEVLRSGLTVRGADPAAVGAAAAAGGVALSSLHRRGPALEEVFLDLVNGTRVHASAGAVDAATVAAATAAAVAAVRPAERAEETTDASAPVATDAEEAAVGAPADAAAAAGVAAAGVAAAAEADNAEGAPAEPPADTAAESDAEPTGDAAGEDAEAALVSAELDAEAAGAPGAATALGAAAGAAWAAGTDGQVDTNETPGEAEHATFAVAGTGIIDIVPSAARAEDERDGDSEAGAATGAATPADAPEPAAAPVAEAAGAAGADPASETEQTSGAEPTSEAEPTSDAAPPDEPEPEPAHPTFAVAGTGVVDVVPPTTQTEPPADADPDVEAIGDIDEELSITSPPESDDDRPWESYEKTDADLEADRFFAAFDTGEDSPGSSSEGAPEPEPEPESADSSRSLSERVSIQAQSAHSTTASETKRTEPGEDSEPEPEPDVDDGSERFDSLRSLNDRDGEPAPELTHDDQAEASAPAEDAEDDGLGTLADLSPDWVETDVNEHRDDEGGER